MQPLQNFLARILPGEGVKCWTAISSGHARNHFCRSFDEMADQILASSARGVDTYHACAAFKTEESRKAANAMGAKALWLDIDAGEGKPYATADDAIGELDRFCGEMALDAPGLVRSGGGVHAYWVFDAVLDPPQWVELAQRFKRVCELAGFKADPSRTADISSILRSPGTHNYKIPGSPRLVSLDDFAYLDPVSWEYHSGQLIKILQEPGRFGIKTALNDAVMGGITVSKFAQVKDGAVEGSRHDALCTYVGGLFRQGFTLEPAMEECLRWNESNKPPLPEDEVRRTVASIHQSEAAKQPEQPVEVTLGVPKLPWPFVWGNDYSLQIELVDKDKQKTRRTLSRQTVYVASRLCEEGNRDLYSLLFRRYDPLEGWKKVAVSYIDARGTHAMAKLQQLGINIAHGADEYFKRFITEMTDMLSTQECETRYSQMGWKNNFSEFLLGDKLYKADGSAEAVVGSDKLTPFMRALHLAKGGSLQEWTVAADSLFAPGMEDLNLMLLTSFASVLMALVVDPGNGGVVVSIVSEHSGGGKTPLIAAAASVWGPLTATRFTGNFTDNRLIEDMVRLRNIVQIIDEAGENYGDPKFVSRVMERFTSGTDRGRMTQAGVSAGSVEDFQTIRMPISNKSLYDVVKLGSEPMARRIFEIRLTGQLDKHAISTLGVIAGKLLANHGYAGQTFVRNLLHPEIMAWLKNALQGDGANIGWLQQKYRDALNTLPEHRYLVWYMAALEASALLVNNFGILHFDVDRIMKRAVEIAVRIRKDMRMPTAIDHLQDYLMENLDHMIVVPGSYDPRTGPLHVLKHPRGQMNIRYETMTGRLVIVKKDIRRWCSLRGVAYEEIYKHLAETGVLYRDERATPIGAGTEYFIGRPMCWEIDMKRGNMSEVADHLSLVVDNQKKDIPQA